MVYAVIDTNVIVASLLTKHHDSATARVMDAVFSGKVIPLLTMRLLLNTTTPSKKAWVKS